MVVYHPFCTTLFLRCFAVRATRRYALFSFAKTNVVIQKVSLVEFKRWLATNGAAKGMTEEDVEALFRSVDVDGSGKRTKLNRDGCCMTHGTCQDNMKETWSFRVYGGLPTINTITATLTLFVINSLLCELGRCPSLHY